MTRSILLLIKGLGRGGAEHIVASSAMFGDRGRFHYEVAYVLTRKQALVNEIAGSGVPVHRLSDTGRSWPAELRRIVIDQGIDLVHGHSPIPAVASRLMFRRGRPRIIYTEHNVWDRYVPLTRFANAATFFRNDHVFAVSETVRRSIRPVPGPRRGFPPVETLVHGIDPRFAERWNNLDGVREEFGIEDHAPLVVTIANFKAHKGHEHLLRAATQVHRALPDARFLLAGVGPLESRTRNAARENGLDGSVVFAGIRDDAPGLAAAADVFVLPSEHEGLPIALLEAMALGRPSVVTSVGGIPEVIHDGRQGLLVPPADPNALADGIVALLNDAALRRRMGEAARARARDFDIRKAIARIEEVYEELLS